MDVRALKADVEKQLVALLEEIEMSDASARFRLRMFLEITYKNVLKKLKPEWLEETDGMLHAGVNKLMLDAWDGAMLEAYPCDEKRLEMRKKFGVWVSNSYRVEENEIGPYLDAISKAVYHSRSAA